MFPSKSLAYFGRIYKSLTQQRLPEIIRDLNIIFFEQKVPYPKAIFSQNFTQSAFREVFNI